MVQRQACGGFCILKCTTGTEVIYQASSHPWTAALNRSTRSSSGLQNTRRPFLLTGNETGGPQVDAGHSTAFVLLIFHEVLETYLIKRENKEGSATAGFHDYGNKFRVDWTEGTVPCDLWHPDIIVALVILSRLAKDVTEFALSYNSFHICVETKFGMSAWWWTNTHLVLRRATVAPATLPKCYVWWRNSNS